MTTVTFGIEEEFVLLDPDTLSTVDAAPAALEVLARRHLGCVTHEFYLSQVEYSSPAFAALDEGRTSLARFRADLARWAEESGVVAASVGTPFRTTPGGRIHADARYERIASDIAALTVEHQINGMHVHVGIAGREEAVRASDALRPWLPTLLALSANSPYWQGSDTGWASWRALHSRRWTTPGMPPRFGSAEAHDRTLAALRGLGAISDPGTVNWNVRVSATHPTVETRVCDGQLDLESTLALAAIIRALVHAADRDTTPREPAPGVWDAALWHAGRHGLSADLLEPRSGCLAPAQIVVRSLRGHIADALTALGDEEAVDAFLVRVMREGTGAAVQRRSARHGEQGLAELYRQRLSPATSAGSGGDRRATLVG